MTELDLARAQMAMLFAFHILFAVAGMGMPVLMVLAESAHIKTRKPVYAELARRWARPGRPRRSTYAIEIPRDERPNPVPVHLAFQVMVACGMSMAAVAAAAAILKWKRRERLFSRPFLRAVAACGPLGPHPDSAKSGLMR